VWESFFGTLPPVAHLLRPVLPDRWLRIHSLPDSKRYADSDAEVAEVLRRHREVAAEVLGRSADAILFLHVWGSEADFDFTRFGWAHGLAPMEPLRETSDDMGPIVVGAFRIRWTADGWDALLRDVADDRLSSVVLLNPETGEVYAPYDGGADLFLAGPERVAELKKRWSAWLSEHPLGL